MIDSNVPGTLFRISLHGCSLDGWKGICRLADVVGLIDGALAAGVCEDSRQATG